MIPKILFQTSYKPIEPYVTEKLKKYISDEWTYLHFNDDEIKEFFRKITKISRDEVINGGEPFKKEIKRCLTKKK